MEDPENRDCFRAQLVPHNVSRDTELPYLARLVPTELLTSPGKLQQRSRASDEPIKHPVRCIEVTLCQEVVKPAQIRLSGG
jgi:hypothetical protein